MSILRKLFAGNAQGSHNAPPRDAASQPGRPELVAIAAGVVNTPPTAIIADAAAMTARHAFGEALALVDSGLAHTPDDPKLQFARASTLLAWGRSREAYVAARRVEALGSRHVALFALLGRTSFHLGNLTESEGWMRKALAGEPTQPQSHLDLAFVLQAQKRPVDAAAIYERALALDARNFDGLIGLGMCRLEQSDSQAAEDLFRRAIAVDAGRAVAWDNLGVALAGQDRAEEACAAFERAVELAGANDEDVESFSNLAANFRDTGRVTDALAVASANLARHPNVYALLGYGHLLLQSGRLREGWSFYEFRWLQYPLLQRRLKTDRPLWDGQELAGKTIMLREEQGFGDLIQFIRYARHVKAQGATVILGTTAAMKNLARGVPGVDAVIGPGDPVPEFDYYINLLSLPRIFGTDLATIPAEIPYLQAEADRVAQWESALGSSDRRKVGVVWAGSPLHQNDRHRSIRLGSLATLASVAGVRLYSLQKGTAADALKSSPPNFELVDLGPKLNDFCDTAAVISQLDLVICVDTAVAHLAGALGKPVWLLLPQPADWRWLEERDDSPWYPTMRLFRQTRRGDWSDVIARVRAALARWVGGDAAQLTPSTNRSGQTPRILVPEANRWPPPGHRPGFSAVAETRMGILQYLPDEDDEGIAIGQYGEVRQAQLDLMLQWVRPGSTVMELGAGVGAHALALAAALSPVGHLLLYEARPVLRRILQQNLVANEVTNCTVMTRRLGAAGGSDTETLDELRLERLDWLKIDRRTSALEIISGGADTLWRLRPWLLVAVSNRSEATPIADRLHEFGYRCWRNETSLFNPRNFNGRSIDVFAGATTFALLALPEEIDMDVALDGCVAIS